MNLGNLAASLTLNIASFMQGMQQAQASVQNLANNMKNSFNFNGMQQGVDALNSGFKDLDRIVSGIVVSQIFYGAVESIKEASSSLVDFTSNMEQAQIAMNYFVGPQNAQGFIMNLQDFATNTHFFTEQIVDLSRRLMAAGVAPDQVRGVLSILNDTAAATGATPETLDRIVLALQEIETRGVVMGKELNQFANNGIPIYSILQQQLGLTAQQMKNIGKDAIPAQVAVTAILQGLSQRYQGAAQQVANTFGGMVRVIQDDMLLIGQQIIQGPYNALEGFTRKIRDTLDTLRKAGMNTGAGGIFEALVPKDLQNPIRELIGTVESLAKSFGILVQAMKPAADMLGQAIFLAVTTIGPPIAALFRALANGVLIMENASPIVRGFTAVIMGLTAATIAGRALMFLWDVTRLGSLCAIVAQAVQLLVKGIQGLTLALMEDPITALIMLVAGALLYLALSSKQASQWMSDLTQKVSALAGIDVNKILQPTQPKNLQEWIDKYNKSVTGLGDNLTGVGDAAQAAGKKVKNSFKASFDEIYQVPQQIAAATGALGALGNLNLGNMGIPQIPSVTNNTNNSTNNNNNNNNIPPIIPPAKGGGGTGNGNGGSGPTPPTDPTAVVTHAIATIESLIAQLNAKLAQAANGVISWTTQVGTAVAGWAISEIGALNSWATNTETAIRTWITNTGNAIGGWVTNEQTTLSGWVTSTEVALSGWATQTGATIANWVSSTEILLSGWAINTRTVLNNWIVQTEAAMSSWATEVRGLLSNWATSTESAFSSWVAQTIANLTSWSASTVATFNTWSVQTRATMSIWSAATIAALTSWISSTENSLANWVAQTEAATSGWAVQTEGTVRNWAATTQAQLASWIAQTQQALTTWTTTTEGIINTWAITTVTTVNNWITQTEVAFAGWVATVRTSVIVWATQTASQLSTWATQTASNLSTWAAQTKANFATWVLGTANMIATWATGTATNITTWIGSTGHALYLWAETTATNFATWGNSGVATIALWVDATGQDIAAWINGTAGGFANWINTTASNMASWGNNVANVISSWASATWGAFGGWLSGTSSGVVQWAQSVLGTIVSWAQSAWNTIKSLANAVGHDIGMWSVNVGNAISSAGASIGGWVETHPQIVVPIAVGAVAVGAVAATIATGGLAAPALLALETGGIVDTDQLVRIGEGNKREAVIPLENSTYMRPFSQAVARDLLSMLNGGSGSNSSSNLPPMYVGTLIADDNGLKELYRKLNVIEVAENQRKGLI